MGARRFGPDTGRFLQPDHYRGAFKDLGLSVDPLTQNRMALGGANPINFVEVDGHFPWRDWGSKLKDAVTDDRVQTALDACGFASGVGAICDVAGAVSYAAEGDWGNAALSAVGAVPGAGDALKAAGTVGAVGMAAYKASDEFAAGTAKVADEGGLLHAVRDDAYTASRHTEEGNRVQRDLRRGREAHVFNEGADLADLEQKVWTEGTYHGEVRGWERYTYESEEAIGRRIQEGRDDVPLHTVEIKGRIESEDEWWYHLVPRTEPAE